MRLFLLLPLLLPGCSEYEVHGKDGSNPDVDTGSPLGGDGDGGDTDTDASTEECNGVDDDGDGEVDEDFEDIDADGIADCIDDDCDADTPAGAEVGVREECRGFDPGEVSDPWDLAVEWQNTSIGTSVSMPAVGNLTDDNSDGLINEDDVPDIAVTNYSGGSAAVLSGSSGSLLFTAAGFRYDAGVAIADVDADGEPELVGPTSDGRVQAYNGDGTREWISPNTYSYLYPIATVADLDADGMPEVISDTAVVSGRDGSHVAALTPYSGSAWRAPVVADLDQDGYAEIILGDSVFDAAGNRLWNVSGFGTSCFNALVEMDSDPEAEVIFAYGNTLHFYNHDGSMIDEVPLPGAYSHPGPPCVGDLDGDGEAEVAVPEGSLITAFELDGSQMWSVSINDSSGAAGCSVFDMNGDQTYEVLFADMFDLIIFDGTTGSRLYENGAHGSVTYFEYPVVADVDLDGSAEIVTASSGYDGYAGVTVFGHNGDGWPESGPTWAVHDFAVTNVNQDGSIPPNPDPSWTKYNVFRGRPSADYAGLPDLTVEVIDTCLAACDPEGVFKLTYQVSNQGEGDVDAGVELGIYMLDSSGTGTLHSTVTLPAVPSGTSIDAGVFVSTLDEIGEGGIALRIDGGDDSTAGIVFECDETNNVARWTESFCR